MSGTNGYLLLTLCVGALLPVQAGINALLARSATSTLTAALVNFIVGVLCLSVVLLVLRGPFPGPALLRATPWYYWVGGLLGASIVVTTVLAAPKLGASTTIALLVTGQMLASILLDHKGWLGYPEHFVSPMRALGAMLLIVGVVLIRRF